MMEGKNFTWELARLLAWVSKVAIAIRMNSPYSGSFDPANPEHGNDVLWLSDAIHQFERLAHAIQSADGDGIRSACQGILGLYGLYESPPAGRRLKGDPAAAFARAERYGVSLGEGKAILMEIMARCEGTATC